MHSALFVARFPCTAPTTWGEFLRKAKVTLRTYPNVSRLSENVWLVNLQENPAPLAYLVSAADAIGVAYGILPFQDKPEWLPAGFDPNTIQGQSEEA
jgi:hypothetical protein